MQVKRVIQYLLEPLLEPLSVLEPLAGTHLEPPFQRTLPADPSSGPFQRWNPFQHLSGTLPANPSSAGAPSSDPSSNLPAPPPPP